MFLHRWLALQGDTKRATRIDKCTVERSLCMIDNSNLGQMPVNAPAFDLYTIFVVCKARTRYVQDRPIPKLGRSKGACEVS